MTITDDAVGMDLLRALVDDDLSAVGAAVLTEVIGKLPLASADLAHGLGAILVRALTGSTYQDGVPPVRAASAALASVATQAHRMVGWWQAIEMRTMAALARPGVAVPLDQVLSAASSALTPSSVDVQSADLGDENGLLSRDFEVEQYSATSVFGCPEWDATVADHATRFAAADIGALLGMSPVTAMARVSEAAMFVDELPETLTCWGNGSLDRSHALSISTSTAVLEPDARRAVEHQLLGADGGRTAGRWTPSRLRSRADRLVIRCDPDATRRGRERARQDRRLEVSPLEEGMARFAAVVDAPVATLAHGVLDTVARGLGREGLEGRTLAQTRADVFADLMVAQAIDGRVDVRGSGLGARSDGAGADGAGLDGGGTDAVGHIGGPCEDSGRGGAGLPPRWGEIGSTVSVIVDAQSLVEPGFLEGHGWIPADLARALAQSAHAVRVIVRRPDALEARALEADALEASTRHSDTLESVALEAASSVAASWCAVPSDRLDLSDPPGTSRPESGPADPPVPLILTPAGSDPVAPARTGTGHHTDSPWCGGVLELGTMRYRPSTALDEHVRRRDRVCRFPGCRRSSKRCDLDHRIPFDQDGPTCPCNLDALCRFHHRLKTFTDWTAIRLPGNRLDWRSPGGHHHVDDPEPMPGDDVVPADHGALANHRVVADHGVFTGQPERDHPDGGPPPF